MFLNVNSFTALQALNELALIAFLAATMSFFESLQVLPLSLFGKSPKNRDFPTSSFWVKSSNFSIFSSHRARIRPVLDHIAEKTQKIDTMSSNEPHQVGDFP